MQFNPNMGNKLMYKKQLIPLLATTLLTMPLTVNASLLTDISVFSSNSDGHYWNGLIWNTQGSDTEPVPPGRWNLYISKDDLGGTTPSFENGFNDSRTRIALPLTTGNNTFSIYAEGVSTAFDAQQHFVMNLYFDGVQSAPGISAVQNLSNSNLAAAGSAMGLDIFGDTWQQEAGSLSTIMDGLLITLTDFSWITNSQRDVVYDYYANDAPYSSGSGRMDFYGSFTLNVISIPEPAMLTLMGLGLAGIGYRRYRSNTVT